MVLTVLTVLGAVADEGTQKAGLKKLRVYDFEYRWLPVVAANIGTENASFWTMPDAIIMLTETNGYEAPFKAEEIVANKKDVAGNEVVVWTMPDPTGLTECYYLAFVTRKNGFDIYTCEKTLALEDMDANMCILGQALNDGHLSYSDVPIPENWEKFIEELEKMKLISAPGQEDPMSGFKR